MWLQRMRHFMGENKRVKRAGMAARFVLLAGLACFQGGGCAHPVALQPLAPTAPLKWTASNLGMSFVDTTTLSTTSDQPGESATAHVDLAPQESSAPLPTETVKDSSEAQQSISSREPNGADSKKRGNDSQRPFSNPNSLLQTATETVRVVSRDMTGAIPIPDAEGITQGLVRLPGKFPGLGAKENQASTPESDPPVAAESEMRDVRQAFAERTHIQELFPETFTDFVTEAERNSGIVSVSSQVSNENSSADDPEVTPVPLEKEADELLPNLARPQREAAAEAAIYSLPEEANAMLVEFHDVLMTASGRNPQVNFANERIREAFAQYQQAELMWLPSLRGGMNYHYHDGKVLNARGEILDVTRNSLYGGMASRVVGGGAVGVPGVWMQFHMADAVYQPQIAEQTTAARRSAARTTRNDTLLAVALAYLQLLQRVQEQAIAVETLENASQLAYLCQDYAEFGLSSSADADRVFTERALRENIVKRATAEIEVASTELARLLSGDPTILLLPQEVTVVPIELVQSDSPPRDLVATGLSNRPELRENRALVQEAIQRLKREKFSPLLPSVVMGMSYGALGGGQGSYMGQFGDRVDFDVALWWEVRQLGLGERALRNENRSRIEQARWRHVQLMDQVAQEVTQAFVQSRARRAQVNVAREGLEFAVDSHRRNMDRIRQGEGLPIEALQSVQALDASRRDYLRAIIEYNEAEFRLYRALGWPIHDWQADPETIEELESHTIELPMPEIRILPEPR